MKNLDRLIAWRRKRLGDPSVPSGAENKWGLALSGGGIRSATFALGLTSALAKSKLLLRFDLMSTVSGGGYTGATIGRLFDRAKDGEGARAVQEGLAKDEATWTTWWLRANGRYLIPSGVLDLTLTIANYLRNLLAVHFEVALMASIVGCLMAAMNIAVWSLLAAEGYSGGYAFFGWVRWLSPWLPLPWLALAPLTLYGSVQAAAFWCLPFVRRTSNLRWWPYLFALLAVLAIAGLFSAFGHPTGNVGADLRQGLGIAIQALLVLWAFGVWRARVVLCKASERVANENENANASGEAKAGFAAATARSQLTQNLATTFRWGGAFVGLGIVERFSWHLAFEPTGFDTALMGVVLAVSAAVLRAALPYIGPVVAGRQSMGAILLVGRALGYLLLVFLAAFWMSLVYRAVLGAYFNGRSLAPYDGLAVALVLLVPTVIYVYVTGRNIDFLNLSSLHAYYRARLVRSYLGAVNPMRFAETGPLPQGTLTPVPRTLKVGLVVSDVEEVHFGDDVSIDAYLPMRSGGPVHLMTMCVNQTSDPRGGMFNKDRRGVPLTITAGGRIRECAENWSKLRTKHPLSLGTFMAISGAAVAPALGPLSRGGISALAMFAGVRLGYWWSSERRGGPRRKSKYPWLPGKSLRIVNETIGNFQGTQGQDWFLTDGGHFENTGAYALIAERCRVILASDAGADPHYAFTDLENLVRKARIDLNASVEFMRPRDESEIRLAGGTPSDELGQFGTLNDLASAHSNACVALAIVTYAEAPGNPAILVYVKPNFFEGLPVDLVNFKAANPAFPQEPTSDQFFSESQWESYFLLGREVAKNLSVELLTRIVAAPDVYFAKDSETTLEEARKREAGASVHDEKDSGSPAEVVSRIPARIARSTVKATIGLGAVAAIGVSAWQGIASWRSEQDKQVESERQALAGLATLWSKAMRLDRDRVAENGTEKEIEKEKDTEEKRLAAMSDLATALLRTADNLCPTGDADWFRRSPLALRIATDAIDACRAVKGNANKPYACVVLEESSNKNIRPTVDNCLAIAQDLIRFEPPPNYWGYNYLPGAPLELMHPCDTQRRELRNSQEEQKALTGAQTVKEVQVLPDECMKKQLPQQFQTFEAWWDGAQNSMNWLFDWTESARLVVARFRAGPAEGSRTQASLANRQPAQGTQGQSTETAIDAGTASTGTPGVAANTGVYTSAPSTQATASAGSEGSAATQSSGSPVEQTFDSTAAANACSGITIYIQVYNGTAREAARQLRDPWRAIRASVPPIEDVTDSARRKGLPAPVPVIRPTIRFHRGDAQACAEILWDAAAQSLKLESDVPLEKYAVEPLAARLASSAKTIEVWLPPSLQIIRK